MKFIVFLFILLSCNNYSYKLRSIMMNINSINDKHRKDVNENIFKTISLLSTTKLSSLLLSPNKANALDDDINSIRYKKAPINLPSDDFWYPPYLIGSWSMSMKFVGANFTDKIPIDVLADNDNVPGILLLLLLS